MGRPGGGGGQRPISLRCCGVEQPRPVQMGVQPVRLGQLCGLLHITERQNPAAQRVFKRQQAGDGEVRIVGFDVGFDVGQRQAAVGLVGQRLRLHAAKHCRAAALHAVTVGVLAHDVLLATLAVADDGAKVAHRACGHEQRRLKTQHGGEFVLQGVDGWVVAKHVIAHRRRHHGLPHRRGGAGDSITSEINHHH